MKKIILVQLLTFMTYLSIGQVLDCDKVKIGKFRQDSELIGLTIITRTADIQREENEKYGIIMEYKIVWGDSCSYTLTPYKVVKNENNLDITTDLKLKTKILEIKNDTYTQRTTSQLNGFTKTGEIKILKD
jgi:hypothetical protein